MPATRFNLFVRREATLLRAGFPSSPWSYRNALARWVRSTRLGSTLFELGDGKTNSLDIPEDETSDRITTWSPDTWQPTNGGSNEFKAVPMPREEPQHSGDGIDETTSADGAVAAPSGSASLLGSNAGGGSVENPSANGSLSVTTDKMDYAPGSTATFTVNGVASGSSVTFRLADLSNAPGVNGIADVYTPFKITDGGTGDPDGVANGTVVAQWQVPADGRATGAMLQLTAVSGSQTATTTFTDAPIRLLPKTRKPALPKRLGDPRLDRQPGRLADRRLCDADQHQRRTNRLLQDRYRLERLHARYLSAWLLWRQRRAARHDHASQRSGQSADSDL